MPTVVALATPYAANAAAITSAGDLAGKILIDVTNPIGANFTLAVGFNNSGAEEVAKLAPRVPVYKAMHQVGFEDLDLVASQLSGRSPSGWS